MFILYKLIDICVLFSVCLFVCLFVCLNSIILFIASVNKIMSNVYG